MLRLPGGCLALFARRSRSAVPGRADDEPLDAEDGQPQGDDDRQALVRLLTDAIDADEQWRDLLSLWGRRLVGDTLLIVRGALRPQTLDAAEEKKVEPVFTDLLAAHSRRMSAIGLDA